MQREREGLTSDPAAGNDGIRLFHQALPFG